MIKIKDIQIREKHIFNLSYETKLFNKIPISTKVELISTKAPTSKQTLNTILNSFINIEKSIKGSGNVAFIKDYNGFYSNLSQHLFYDTKNNSEYYWWKSYLDFHPKLKEVLKSDLKHFIIVDINSYSFYNLDGSIIPQLFYFDYIRSGFIEHNQHSDYIHCSVFDWERLKKYLKNHKYVKELKEIRIPSYNAEFYGQRALELFIFCNNKKTKFYQEFYDKRNRPHRELYNGPDFDPLGVHKFVIK